MNSAEQRLLEKLSEAGLSDPLQLLCFTPTQIYDLRKLLSEKNALVQDRPNLYQVRVVSEIIQLAQPDPSPYGYTHCMEVAFGKHKKQNDRMKRPK